MTAIANIIGLALLYCLVGGVADILAERNRYRYALVYDLQEIVVQVFMLLLWVLAIIVGLTA